MKTQNLGSITAYFTGITLSESILSEAFRVNPTNPDQLVERSSFELSDKLTEMYPEDRRVFGDSWGRVTYEGGEVVIKTNRLPDRAEKVAAFFKSL